MPTFSIIGSRDFPDLALVDRELAKLPPGSTIITGGAWRDDIVVPTRGVDRAAAIGGRNHGYIVVVVAADWDRFGKSAGHRRNPTIIELGDYVLAFWDGKSPGTKGGMRVAYQLGRKMRVILPDGSELAQLPADVLRPGP